jgi:hypothetical protein
VNMERVREVIDHKTMPYTYHVGEGMNGDFFSFDFSEEREVLRRDRDL